jgi:FKBP-type peptidyl-prolyl cis-trans isomerase 2
VGLYVTVNDRIGIIRTVNGGRCLVDFNHPLSGKELVYKIKPLKKITDKKKQVEQIIKTQLRVNDFKLKEKDGKITIVFDEKISKLLNEKMKKVLIKDIKEMTGQTVNIK